MKYKPPKIAVWLLSRLTIPENRYSLAGDAEEEYKTIATENGIVIAYLWYWLQVLISFPPFTKHSIYWRITMLANYFKMALRNILKNKMHSAINIFGLSIGIAFCILIFLYTKNEMTFDNFHEKKDNIYRVLRVDKNMDGTVRRLRGGLPMIVGPTLTAEIAAIKSTVRFLSISSWLKSENYIANEGILFGDPAIFEIFSFKLLAGNTKNPLTDINSVVISRREAEKIFGTAEAEGKTVAIKIENEFRDFTVTGVIENIPENSSIRFDILLNFYVIEHSSRYRDSADKWDHNNSSLFVLLKKNSSETGIKPAIDTFAQAHLDNSPGLRLQRLTDLHLDDSVGANIELVTNPAYSYILTAIALFILVIACINYITISISRTSSRAKEVGMRKVIGADKKHLIYQFWGEALFLSFIAMLCGLLIGKFLLPFFNSLADKNLKDTNPNSSRQPINTAKIEKIVKSSDDCCSDWYNLA